MASVTFRVAGKEFVIKMSPGDDLTDHWDSCSLGKPNPEVIKKLGKCVTHDVNVYAYGTPRIKVALHPLVVDKEGEVTADTCVCSYARRIQVIDVDHPDAIFRGGKWYMKPEQPLGKE
jgi:hypothetical protein